MGTYRRVPCLVIAAALLYMSSGPLWADEGVDLRSRADKDLQIAHALMSEAHDIMAGPASAERWSVAVDLYVKAGQQLEEAAKIYQAISPQYASAQDVQTAGEGMKVCIASVDEIKKHYH